ncbi:hypothetical protein GmarT_20410 [Gimesia maris]|uniref:Uncharacterized protein n=1 Tax=Gimesia maris TaxID=122 RepID=A0ABX5YKM5_9PLAN|nr:hypothetical protein CA11_19910 [Gimesia maris]QEG16180.1 hypothetical protein GmarT_20410 [Gimesia maris]
MFFVIGFEFMLEITRKIAIFICFFFTGFHIGLEQVWSLIVKLVLAL